MDKERKKQSSHNPPDLPAQIASLQAELECLRGRYDALLEAKNRAATRYKADYKKWRDFKRWLLEDMKRDDEVRVLLKEGDLDAYERASTLGKRKKFEVMGPDLGELSEGEAVKGKGKGKERMNSRASLAVHPLEIQTSLCAGAQSPHWESNREQTPKKVLSPSPTNKDVPPAAGEESPMVRGSIKQECQAECSSRIAPATEPRKARGRYAQVIPAGLDTINSKFTINKSHNHGMDFQYDAVVRNRDERRHMLGADCECCQEYYKAIGPLPAPQRPIWRSPKRRTPYIHHMSDGEKENTDAIDQHKKQISRHRYHWDRAKTPPGYWDIGFPDTQEASEINRRAAEMHRRKLIEVEAEARHGNGRYVARSPRTP
ncbi:DNA repair protein endonuclease SAE2/CtIP C-terminus-domain-containing protein [Phlebopus sp. FC_14]|nr:DNA repair protein endonuclease SAE2/CtIP C-terminus-domain-containing protein [Phlebopus sp. FC_14]